MQLEESFTLARAPAALWPAFQDVALLVSCLPGASVTGPIEHTDGMARIPLRFEVRLGPIGAVFVGTGVLTPDHGALTGAFEGSAVDRKTNSRVSGVARFSLVAAEPAAPGTTVQVVIDYSLAGSLAQFNRPGIVRQLASTLAGEFARRLQVKVDAMPLRSTQEGEEGAPTDEVDGAGRLGAPASGTGLSRETALDPPSALNPLSLLWMSLRQTVSKLLARLGSGRST